MAIREPDATYTQKSQLHEAISEARAEVERAEREYLTACGWKYSSSNPAYLWLWSKTIEDGRTLVMDQQCAIRTQCGFDGDYF